MPDKRRYSPGRAAELTLQLPGKLCSDKTDLNVEVRLWDGTRWPDDRPHPTTLVLNQPPGTGWPQRTTLSPHGLVFQQVINVSDGW